MLRSMTKNILAYWLVIFLIVPKQINVSVFDKVISIEAYNEDGKKIIEGIDLRNYNINNAISTLVSHAISEGYIKEDGSSIIEITTSTDKEKVASKLDESLKEVADETLDKNEVKAEIETENVELARRDEARKLGITPGKLNLIQKLQDLDPTITVENYKDSSVKDIQKKAIELRKDSKVEEKTIDSNINSDLVTEENSNTSNNKVNNSNNKKEENSNANKENNNGTIAIEKENNSNKTNSQGNDPLDSESNSNLNLKNNSNSLKSENSNNGNSNSQNKDKNKNN